MGSTLLFSPARLRGLTLRNRIIVSPMSQFSAVDGLMNDWHLIHYGHLALSGAALLTIEACYVSPEGRVTYGDVGLWDDSTQDALAALIASIRRWSDIPIAVQLAHAGRKASTQPPWIGRRQIQAGEPGGWRPVAPSPLPFRAGESEPLTLDSAAIAKLARAFADSAMRAARAGADAVQIHAAHGYLLHQFLSPLSNARTDEFGGSPANRMRFPLAVFDAVRAAFPADRPVTVRVSGTDWVPGGWSIEETIAFARELKARGCDAIDVSSGGLDPRQAIDARPSYQVPLAAAVKGAVDIPVMAGGLITGFAQAEAVLANGKADLVSLGRTILLDPRWPWHAASHFRETVMAPQQYLRAQPADEPELFAARIR